MDWSITGLAGIILFGLAWVIGAIKVFFFDNRKIVKSPTSLDKYDENHPEDFNLVRKYSKKATWIILSLSIVITVGGLAFTTIQIGKYAGVGEGALLSAMGIAFTFALPCAIMWILNMVCLNKWVRKEGTSLEIHAQKEPG